MIFKSIWRRAFALAAALTMGAAIPHANAASQWDALVAAAKKEGALILNGPQQPPHRAVLEQFGKEFGIQVQYTGLRNEFWSRVESERAAGVFAWDVFVGGIPGTAYDAVKKGWLEPIKERIVVPELLDDAKWMSGFDAGFGDNQRKYIYEFSMDRLPLFAVNRSIIPKNELSSSKQLLDPKWKGKILMMDPRPPSLGALTLGNLRLDLGDDGARKLLREQDVQIVYDLRQSAEAVVRGERPIALGVTPGVLATFTSQGLGQNIEFLDSLNTPLSPSQGSIALIANAPHPNAAKLFLNWVLTQKVQADYAKASLTSSRRTDVPSGNPPTAVTLEDIRTLKDSSSEKTVNYYYVDSAAFGQSILD